MPGFTNSIRQTTALILALIVPGLEAADEPSPPKSEARKAAEAIKPLPPGAIPDNPPPHEGAMIDIPSTIEPPDILVVEVLEALPGRPITGERLVRPDGTISLGFYGDVHVRGLTAQQVKVKLIHHLREHLNDDILGLTTVQPDRGPIHALPKPGTVIPDDGKSAPAGRSPYDPNIPSPPLPPPNTREGLPSPGRPSTDPTEKPEPARSRGRSDRTAGPSPAFRGGSRLRQRNSRPILSPGPGQEPKPSRPEVKPAERPEDPGIGMRVVAVDPIDSLHVFVDVSAHNSRVYFVQGDVAAPGRLPFTGKDSVLDALNYAGGFVGSAEPKDVHLYRPAHGGKPARDYWIDIEAIHKGDARANLQLFPNDRLVIGRSAIARKAADLDRVAAPINSVFNTIFQYSFAARSLAAIGLPPSSNPEVKVGGQAPGTDPSAMTAALRDANLKEWFEILWNLSNQEAGKTLDEKALREALLKKLTTPPTTEPQKK